MVRRNKTMVIVRTRNLRSEKMGNRLARPLTGAGIATFSEAVFAPTFPVAVFTGLQLLQKKAFVNMGCLHLTQNFDAIKSVYFAAWEPSLRLVFSEMHSQSATSVRPTSSGTRAQFRQSLASF